MKVESNVKVGPGSYRINNQPVSSRLKIKTRIKAGILIVVPQK